MPQERVRRELTEVSGLQLQMLCGCGAKEEEEDGRGDSDCMGPPVSL